MAKAKTPKNFSDPRAAAVSEGVGVFGRLFRSKKAVAKLEQGVAGKAAGAAMHEAEALAGRQVSKGPRPGLFLTGATGVTAGIGSAHGVLSRINSYVFGVGMVAGALGAMGKLPVIGKAFSSTAGVITKPKDYLEKTSVSEFTRVGSTALGSVRGFLQKRSPESSLIGKLDKAHGVLSGAEEKLFQGIGQQAGKVSSGVGSFVERHAGGVLGAASKHMGGRAATHSAKAGGILAGLTEKAAGNSALGDVAKHFGAAQTALGAGNHEAVQEALGSAVEGLKASGVDRKLAGSMQKAIAKAGETAAAAAQHSGTAGKLSGLPDAIRNAPEAIGKSNLSNFALKGALVTGTALQVTGTAKGIAEKIHVLKQVHSDLTGQSKISTRKLMFGKDVPPLVKELRGQIVKEYGPRMVLNIANTVATYTFLKKSGIKSMLGSAALMGVTSLHNAKVQSYGVLPMYQAMNQNPQISDVEYAQFISAASKDAAAAGGVNSPMVQALALDYAKEGVRPAEVLKEISNGKFDERALAKAQASKAASAAQGAAAPNAVGAHAQRELDRRQFVSQETAR